jgi:ElaB/YqjD/DUF883 family membrane-anchored ribosome-binding protein
VEDLMNLTRKRQRELKKLRSLAEDVLEQQKEVFGHAGTVLHEATRQARHLSDEVVGPRVDSAYQSVRPTLDRGIFAARRAADQVRRVTTPVVAAALASAVHKLDQIEQHGSADELRRFGEKSGLLPTPKKRGLGSVLAIGLGVVAAAAVGYALWQAFRTDDELWIAPESDA